MSTPATTDRCTCAWHVGMRDPEPGCPVDHDRRTPLFQYTGQIDGKAIRVDVVWDGFEPRLKWSTHDPA